MIIVSDPIISNTTPPCKLEWSCKVKRKYNLAVCEYEISTSTSGNVSQYLGLKAGIGITTTFECGWVCGEQTGLVAKFGGTAALGKGVTATASATLNDSGGGVSASGGLTTGYGISGGPGVGLRW